MATIQVRDLSAEAHATLRQRAKAAGMSLQSYMRNVIEQLAQQPTDAELFVEIERFAAQGLPEGVNREQLLSDVDAERR